MADTFYFSRDTKVYLIQNQTTSGTVRWDIPVLDGFSFSQATNTSEITLNEMQEHSTNKSRRSRQMFTDSYAPAEWSFSTYMRPFQSTNGATGGWEASGSDNQHHCVEEPLWANFVAANSLEPSVTTTEALWADGVTASTSNTIFDFTGSEKAELGTFDLYFEMGGAGSGTKTVYKLEGAVVNSASIDFDIDGIATINWSGFAKIISEVESGTVPSGTVSITEGSAATDTGNFIRNRLTTLQAENADSANFSASYSLTLTGGNITFENNITFLTPETLGVVNQPIGHVTGTRSVSGNFTCYLNAETDSSADLFEDIIEATDDIVNAFDLTFNIGGASTPKVTIEMPNCHLEVPSHSIDDIISIETNFHALPASIDPDSTADNYEAKITYTGA